MNSEWTEGSVSTLQAAGLLLVEDGNHGESRPRPHEFVPSGIAFIRAADIDSNGNVLFDRASKISTVARDRITKGIGAPGDILLTHKGTVGKVGRVLSDAPAFVCSPQTTFWRSLAPNSIDQRYLHAYLRSPFFHQQLAARAGETDMAPYVSLTSQRAIIVRYPPLPEQRAIAHILGTLDDKIELNRRTNETLEAMARALFKSWFVDFDPVHAKKAGRKPEGMDAETAALFPDDFEDSEMGKIPRGWRVAPVTTMQDGGKYACTAGPFGSNLTSRDYVDFGIPVIRGGNLSGPSLWLTNDAFVFVSLEKARQLSSNTAHPGDVIFTQRGTLGQVAIIPPDGQAEYILSQSQMKLRVDALTSSPFYVALYFRQERVIDQIVANGQQAGVPHVNLGFLRKFPTLIPDSRVLRSFDAIVRVTYSGVLRKLRESATLSALRDALLPQLLSGSLRVPEAMRLVEKVI